MSDPKLGTTVAEAYRLDERLGQGGMGVVYRGEEVATGRPVAVKFLHDALAGITDLKKRFDREVAAMRRLRHPNLVAILDSGVQAGVPYLVMEFLEGRPLSELLERGALSHARAVRIARQVLAGVQAAHESGVVHRDLKPDNILLVGAGDGEQVKILDFGLAKMVHGSASAATQLTNTGLALGTPAYMSPEQARGTPTDHRSDLYSVGVILYHMLVGRKPFVAESPMTVMRMHMDNPPVAPRKAAPDAGISPAMERAILRAMEKDAGARFPDAKAFLRALDGTPEGGARSSRRLPLQLLAKLAAVGVLVAGGWAGWRKLTHHGWQKQQQTVRRAVDNAVDTAVGGAKAAVDKTRDVLRAMTPSPEPKPPVRAESDDDTDDDRDPTPPRDTPGARQEAAAAGSAVRKPHLKDAVRLINGGKVDEGVQVLYQLRKEHHDSPDVALWLGHAYFRKLWRTDGLREYDMALEGRPSLRHDTLLVRNAVAALDDPTYRLARGLLRKRVGTAALPELRRAVRDPKNARIQSRATRLGLELAHGRRRK